MSVLIWGAQWLSGRVLDSRPKGCEFEPHRHHYVVSLSKNINPSLVLVQPMKTLPFVTERLLMGCIESKQTKNLVPKLFDFLIVFQKDFYENVISVTVCKGYQQMTKVTTSKEKVKKESVGTHSSMCSCNVECGSCVLSIKYTYHY